MKITINEPCHENWDAMTPNDKGAFCKSCVKDVVDFSKMTMEEIKSFFSKPQSGNVCGRFEENQLSELTFDDFFAKFRYWNFAKKFAVIFFFTFGFALFSTNAMAQDDRHMMKGEVRVMPDNTPKKDTTKKQTPVNPDKKLIKGKVAKVEPTSCGSDRMTMGLVAAQPQKAKVIEPVPEKKPEIDTTKKEAILEPYHILGQISVQDIPKKEVCKPDPIVIKDSVAPETERIADNSTQINIYPNPSTGNLVIETNIDAKQTVNIYDEAGRIALTQIINGTTTINAAVLTDGVYHVIITGGANDAVIKKKVVIVK